ncbi:hypothetical protein Btru_018427 [Bulinus truncatus]|nr:hypothetical protein Btru_018427 [Bulinus truncatus]
MDYHELMNLAASKHENLSKTKNVSRYSLDLPAPKKEEKAKAKSAVVQNLLKEKEQEREKAERAERERQEEERKKNQFRIPKKKTETSSTDKETLIKSLFDDDFDGTTAVKSTDIASDKHSSHHTSKVTTLNGKTQSNNKTSHINGKSETKDSKIEHVHCKPSLENSSRKHEKHKSSSDKTQPVGSSINKLKSLSQTPLETKPSSHSSSNSTKNISLINGVDKKRPVNASSKHANERPTNEMTEKEKILARLQAIKQRTLEAIHKENAAKGKRVKGERSHRKSKADDKLDEKAKSVEIIKDDDDSEDDSEVKNIPNALDIMLSDRNAKLEKEKISRMAKQAWERATKQQSETDEKVKNKSKKSRIKERHSSDHTHKSSHKDKKSHSLSHDSHNMKVKPKKKIIKSSRSVPPPLDFKAILAMAEQKQKAPPKPVATIPKKKKEEEERPLTQEEKDRRERLKSKEYQDWLKHGGQRPGTKDETTSQKPFSVSSDSTKFKVDGNASKSSSLPKHSQTKPTQSDITNKGSNKQKSLTVNENILVCGPEEESEEESSPVVDSSNPFDRIIQKVHKKRPGPQLNSGIPKKQQILDSEEEDSDMDSFIDDGDCEVDYSSEIQKMFGYNKNKYKDEDEDLSNMEADFKTVMMEEKRSAKLGLLEDLEDMKREEEELKRKAMKNKMSKKGK